MSDKDEKKPNPVEGKEENKDLLDDSLGKTEEVLLQNKKKITNVLLAVVIVLGGFVFWKKGVHEPAQLASKNVMWEAQYAFEKDSFALATELFADIMDEYGSTDAANGSALYKAISEMNLGNFEQALDDLNDFSAEGYFFPAVKSGLKGDCYSELGEVEDAVSAYKKAGKKAESEVLTPYYYKKAGILLEQNDRAAEAVELYKKVLDEYYYEGNAQYVQQRNDFLRLYNRANAAK